jgi:hypothetical protein
MLITHTCYNIAKTKRGRKDVRATMCKINHPDINLARLLACMQLNRSMLPSVEPYGEARPAISVLIKQLDRESVMKKK